MKGKIALEEYYENPANDVRWLPALLNLTVVCSGHSGMRAHAEGPSAQRPETPTTFWMLALRSRGLIDRNIDHHSPHPRKWWVGRHPLPLLCRRDRQSRGGSVWIGMDIVAARATHRLMASTAGVRAFAAGATGLLAYCERESRSVPEHQAIPSAIMDAQVRYPLELQRGLRDS